MIKLQLQFSSAVFFKLLLCQLFLYSAWSSGYASNERESLSCKRVKSMRNKISEQADGSLKRCGSLVTEEGFILLLNREAPRVKLNLLSAPLRLFHENREICSCHQCSGKKMMSLCYWSAGLWGLQLVFGKSSKQNFSCLSCPRTVVRFVRISEWAWWISEWEWESTQVKQYCLPDLLITEWIHD